MAATLQPSAIAASTTSAAAVRIPSLDGVRAVSILMVIVGHSFRWDGVPSALPQPLLRVIGAGDLGVSIFFVISGFLITTLLLREEARTGAIRLPAFFLRRAYRIWPAYLVLLGTAGLLTLVHVGRLNGRDFLSALLFVWNYTGGSGDSWTLAHTWSLSVEEQFYLVWPATMLLAGSQARRHWIAITIIALSPFVRVTTYLLVPSLRAQIGVMGHTRADTLMFGCLLALVLSDERGSALLDRVIDQGWQWVALAVLFAIEPWLKVRYAGGYMLPIGFTLEGLSIACVLAWVVRRPDTAVGRVLNSRWVVHIGVLSYSLYLWQQLFARNLTGLPATPLAIRLLLLVAVAEASYRFVEAPMLRRKRRSAAARA